MAAAPRDTLAKLQLDNARKAYLAGKIPAAEKALDEAAKACKVDKDCSVDVRAQIFRDRGVLQAEGKKAPKEAEESFKQALALDPKTTLPSALSTPAVIAAFDAAKAPPPPKVDPQAPPPPPPPPPPEPKPLREVATTKAQFQRGVGLIMPSPTDLPVEHGTTGPGPITAAKPPVTTAWLQQMALGYARPTFRPSVEGLEPCPSAESHAVGADFEFDRHVPGTVVGHRLRFPVMFGFPKSGADCRTLTDGPRYVGGSFTYGLDLHAPLPGVLHGLSLGGFIGPEGRVFWVKTGDVADETVSMPNLALLGGGHGRFRYGHPETGFNAYVDGSVFARTSIVEGAYTGVYRRFELKLAYKKIGLLGYLEQRLSASGGAGPFESNAEIFANTASLYDLKGIALVIN